MSPATTRDLTGFTLAACVLLAGLAAVAVVRVHTVTVQQAHRLESVRACLSNNAYPRELLGQCLNDYAVMRGWSR